MTYSRYDKLNVLVIDDFRQFLVTVKAMLEDFGVKNVDLATNATEALAFCEHRSYDVILSDYNLGQDKKNGQQVLEALRIKSFASSNALFILITAETGKSMVMATYDYEPDGYLSKPFNTKLLQQRLDRLLSRRDALKPIQAAIREGQLANACQMCSNAISQGGRYATECKQTLGDLHYKTGAWQEAEALYREVLAERETPWASYGLARVFAASKRKAEAIEQLEQLIIHQPQYMQAYGLLAELLKEQGNTRHSQEVLAKAVAISPLSLLRQKDLAQVAEENKDMGTAAHAWLNCVQLGTHSHHDSLDTHLSLGRTAAALLTSEPDEGRKLSATALKTLENASKRFDTSREGDVKILLLRAQVYAGLGEKADAEDLLRRAEKLLEVLEDQVDIDTKLDWLATLTANGEERKARSILQSLISESEEDEAILEKVDHLLPEPCSKKNRKLIADINKRGIDLYNQKEYQSAITCFSDASKRFPKHIGIHLNLMQSIISELREKGFNDELALQVEHSLKYVGSAVTEDNPQHKRYSTLRDKYVALKQAKVSQR